MRHLTQRLERPLDLLSNTRWSTYLLSCVILLIVGGTLGRVAYDQYQQTEESEYRLLEAHARNADVQIVEAMEDVEHLLDMVALEHSHRHKLHGKAFPAFLELQKKDIPESGTLLVTDARGRIIASSDTALIGRDVSQESYFTAHTAPHTPPGLFLSRPDKRLTNTSTAFFSLPVTTPEKKFSGIVALGVSFKFFQNTLRAINPDDSASMSVIFNRDGDLLYRRSDPEKFFGNNISKVSTVLQEHASSGERVTRHIGPSAHNGKTRLFLVRDVGTTGLSLIQSRQLDEVLADWRRNVIVYILIFTFTCAAVIALLIASARRKQLEKDVANSNERLRAIERRQMLSQERQRLMQDMHDGLGSSLVSALRVVENGHLDEIEITQVLKACIDDLKLAIDSMEPVDADLLLLLATLRFRLGPRLESTGIALSWEVRNVPKLEWLDPKNALHILRILQEAFTNIIKHTQATEIRVATAADESHVQVTITDNGTGFDVDSALSGGGKGLSNQLRRAQAIAAEVHWASAATGTCFTLRLPIQRKPA